MSTSFRGTLVQHNFMAAIKTFVKQAVEDVLAKVLYLLSQIQLLAAIWIQFNYLKSTKPTLLIFIKNE